MEIDLWNYAFQINFTCFWRTNSYSLAFRLNWHTFQNQSSVSFSVPNLLEANAYLRCILTLP